MSETRKLQKIGKTLYISIPKSWSKKMQLKRGDKINIILQPDNSLCMCSVNSQETPREITLKITPKTSTHSIRREIVAAYVDGFDMIKVTAAENISDDKHDAIRDIINSLFGLELIEISKNSMTIQCLLTRSLEIDKTIHRIHNVISSMFDETIAALRKQNSSQISGLSRRMEDIRRLHLVSNRLLRSLLLFPTPNNRMEISLIDCVDYLQILHLISEIASNVHKISESVSSLNTQELPKQISEPLYQVSATIKRSLDNSVEALLSKDISLANQILDLKHASEINLEELWKFCSNAGNSELSSRILSHAYLLIDCLKRINHHSAEISEIAIDRAEASTANGQKV
ncbi:AbrB/MazE/SpoVT family DNA-binding domain-containing protein [Candidatus Bathyarchaeota archaeon]|nr:AbrB/MazE/SpoVT family DNA-binding domain-containing protein [Candidatus Bathyarchaeota archaeon]